MFSKNFFEPIPFDSDNIPPREAYVQNNLLALTHFWYGLILLLGVFLFLFLGVTDHYVAPELFSRFLLIRLGTATGLLSLFFLNLRMKKRGAELTTVRAVILLTTLACAAVIEKMILELGGDSSGYYAGMSLLGICTCACIPMPLRWSILNTGIVYGTYIGPILLFDEITNHPVFVQNNLFLASVLIICLVWRSFGQENIVRNFILQHEVATERHKLERYSRDLEDMIEERTREKLSTERLFSTLFDAANDAILLLDRNGYIVDANQKACHIYGFQKDILVGSHMGLFEPWDSAEHKKHRETILAGVPLIYEVIHRGRNGVLINFEVSATAVEVGGKELIQAIHRDVTEKKALQKQLQHSQKMDFIGQLAGGIAHDFNNILTAILGVTELVLARTGRDPYIAHKMNTIDAAARKGTRMIAQLLSFARKGNPEKARFDIKRAITEACDLARSVIPSNIRITQQLPDPGVVVMGEAGQMEQVIMNLVVNARDAMPAGGDLSILCEIVVLGPRDIDVGTAIVPGKYVSIRVADTGSGVPEEHLPHIFEPFFTTKEAGKGTGLGLAMVYGIVKDHSGYIVADKRPEGGMSFTIYLPILTEIEDAGKIGPVCDIPRRKSGRILCIEDENAILDFMREVLETQGFDVIANHDPMTAMGYFEQEHENIDLVITDMTMPSMTGLGVINHLKEIRPHARVLGVAGEGEFQKDRYPLLLNGFLKKPFTSRSLVLAVDDALGPAVEIHGPL